MLIDPGHPLLQIALALDETKSAARAEFLREYGLVRLPNDAALCCQAAELLLDQKDHQRAACAIEKAAKVDPNHPDLVRLRNELQRLLSTRDRVTTPAHH